MFMATGAAAVEIDATCVATALQEVLRNLETAETEIMLDFSAVHRMDASALRALQQLADAAEEKKIKVVLRGISAEVYRVLRLLDAAQRFSLAN
jgi:anti-anti-sigma factor